MPNSQKLASKTPGRAFALLGLLIVAVLIAWIGARRALAPVSPGSTTHLLVIIPKGVSTQRIGEILARRHLVHSAEAFVLASRLTGTGGRLKSGTYDLSPGQDAEQIAGILAAGKVDTDFVTVPEGFTAQQISERLADRNLGDAETFLTLVRTQGATFRFEDGFAPPENLEGYLFPLTYRIPKGTTPRAIVQMMLDGFDTNVVQRYSRRRDWHRVVILASLIEAESQIDKDRPLIASVYLNRLRRGMPLQCDATVEYALPQHKTRLLFSDLKTESPYNTYLHRGLPPAAICNPGLASIDAALHPAKTDYLYYVAGPGGASVFSRTLAEQDRAIARIRG